MSEYVPTIYTIVGIDIINSTSDALSSVDIL